MTRARVGWAAAALVGVVAAALATQRALDRFYCTPTTDPTPRWTRVLCARADAKLVPVGLEEVLQMPDPNGRLQTSAAMCGELRSCAGNCRRALMTIAGADLNQWPLSKDAVAYHTTRAAAESCDEFVPVAASESRAQVHERAWALVRGRLAPFVGNSCRYLDARERARVSCAAVRLGLQPMPGACGNAGPECSAPTTGSR